MRLIEWNDMRLLVRGERIAEIVRAKNAGQKAPVREVELKFHDSLLEITGKFSKIVSLRFRVEIRRIDLEGSDVVLHIDSISAAGIRVPTFLGKLFEKQIAGGGVMIDGNGPMIRIRLDHFLPEFVDVTMSTIRISDEGIVAVLGRGGIDPPEGAI